METIKEKLEALVPKLVALGEDEKELGFWLKVFDDLKEDEQTSLIRNLEEELSELSRK